MFMVLMTLMRADWDVFRGSSGRLRRRSSIKSIIEARVVGCFVTRLRLLRLIHFLGCIRRIPTPIRHLLTPIILLCHPILLRLHTDFRSTCLRIGPDSF